MVNELPLLCEAGQLSPAVLMTIESSRLLKTGQALVAEADELDGQRQRTSRPAPDLIVHYQLPITTADRSAWC